MQGDCSMNMLGTELKADYLDATRRCAAAEAAETAALQGLSPEVLAAVETVWAAAAARAEWVRAYGRWADWTRTSDPFGYGARAESK